MRGPSFEFGLERFEDPIEVIDDIVVPEADHAIAKGAQLAVALPVFGAARMLAAIV